MKMNKKLLLIVLLSLAIISAIVLVLLTPKIQNQNGTTSLIPSANTPPAINLQPVSPSQILIINWSDVRIVSPKQLPYYTITSPLIDSNLIKNVAVSLGFSANDAKKTLTNSSYLYSKNNQSLFASTAQNQIQYTYSASPSSTAGFPSLTRINQKVSAYLQQFFPNQTFQSTSEPEYFYTISNDTYPQRTTPAKSNLVRLNYQQTLNGYPFLTTATGNSIISFTYDSNQILHSIEISGGYLQTSANTNLNILDLPALKQIASQKAVSLSLDAITDVVAQIQNSAAVTLDVSDISLVYFATPSSSQILPVFLIKGQLKGNSFGAVRASYIVPAAK